MLDLSVLREIFVLLTLALVNAWLFSRLKQSPIVGYLVTGLLVGPYGFHLVKGIHEVEIVAEIGVILLLFTIGLEFSYSRIIRLKGLLLKAGTTQLAATALARITSYNVCYTKLLRRVSSVVARIDLFSLSVLAPASAMAGP